VRTDFGTLELASLAVTRLDHGPKGISDVLHREPALAGAGHDDGAQHREGESPVAPRRSQRLHRVAVRRDELPCPQPLIKPGVGPPERRCRCPGEVGRLQTQRSGSGRIYRALSKPPAVGPNQEQAMTDTITPNGDRDRPCDREAAKNPRGPVMDPPEGTASSGSTPPPLDMALLRELAAELWFWPATTIPDDIERHREHNVNADFWLARSHRFDHLKRTRTTP